MRSGPYLATRRRVLVRNQHRYWTPIGHSGDANRYGLSTGTVDLTTCLTLGFAVVFLFPFFIRNRVFTTSEFLETRYHPTARILFSGLMLAISITTKLAFHL